MIQRTAGSPLAIRIGGTLFLLVAIGLFVSPLWGQLAPTERVAAVNGEDIAVVDFEAALQQALHHLDTPVEELPELKLQALRRDVLDNLIGRKLAYQECLRLGFKVEDEQIDKELERVAARFSSVAEQEDAFLRTGISPAQLRARLHEDLAIRQLIEEQVAGLVEVDEWELRSFYDTHPNLFKVPALVKASHIFIAAGPDSTREERKAAVALIRGILEQLDQGVPFSEMAIDYSQCPSSENGGDLGYFEREKMIKGFADAAFSLNPGEISDIVRTSRGYHLILVEDRQAKHKLAFDNIRERLYQNLKFEKAAPAIKAYLKSLREAADVQIFIAL